MHLIIDIFNLLHQDKDLIKLLNKSYDSAFQRMIDLVAIYAKKNPKIKITCVFDGELPEIDFFAPNIRIEASGTYQKADDVIKEYIRVAVNPKLIKVVSSDREILSFAKMNYSQWYMSEDFMQELKFLSDNEYKNELVSYNQIEKSDKSDILLHQFQAKELTKDDYYGMNIEFPEYSKEQSSTQTNSKIEPKSSSNQKDEVKFENKKVSLKELMAQHPKKKKQKPIKEIKQKDTFDSKDDKDLLDKFLSNEL